MNRKTNLYNGAPEIFGAALLAADPVHAVLRAIVLDNSKLRLHITEINIGTRPVYVIALGKAATAMSVGLEEVLGDKLTAGIACSPPDEASWGLNPDRWEVFRGGHPFPTEGSLAAARASVNMLRSIPEGGLVVFLVSGGGSAMFELPVDERITLNDLREANRQLVQCGATIAEINSVRGAFSAVKGGKLSDCAPHADQITLIVSDTNPGDEAAVASGPTLRPAESAPDAAEVLRRYGLDNSLPESILTAIVGNTDSPQPETDRLRIHQVLLDNHNAIEAAARYAEQLGFLVEVAEDINEQEISAGCELLVSRAHALFEKSAKAKTVCLISGGEFSCPVRGEGVGGRNSETVLRCAMRLSEVTKDDGPEVSRWIVLSAGTDGIDGNSPAAGAVADETTVARGLAAGLDASDFLARSDSFNYFQRLGDVLVTGATGTNVRDIRIIIRTRDE